VCRVFPKVRLHIQQFYIEQFDFRMNR
jgi:hypothetical protein